MSKTEKQHIGTWGEERAVGFLADLGYEIVCRNYLVKGGEIDIVAWHKKRHFGKTLCFIEVKTRTGLRGSAERATDEKKMAHLRRAATLYCLEHKIDIDRTPMQFEHVSVYRDDNTGEMECLRYEIPV